MKPLPLIALVVSLFLASYVNANAQNRTKAATIYKTISSTGTPEALVSTNLFVRTVTLLGMNEFRSSNSGTCYVGFSSGNDEQLYPLLAGGEVVITAPENQTFNLKDVYIDVTSNSDTVTVIYFP